MIDNPAHREVEPIIGPILRAILSREGKAILEMDNYLTATIHNYTFVWYVGFNGVRTIVVETLSDDDPVDPWHLAQTLAKRLRNY